jgi:hypothetical protein
LIADIYSQRTKAPKPELLQKHSFSKDSKVTEAADHTPFSPQFEMAFLSDNAENADLLLKMCKNSQRVQD